MQRSESFFEIPATDWSMFQQTSKERFLTFLDAGYFMHFSTKVGNPLESALLESRTLYPKRKLQCLQFFYKMTGSPKDKLVIWVKMDDGTGTIRKMRKIHTFYGRLFFSVTCL